jgi:nucleotide-binding universal stress UspA family protein
MSKGIIVPTDFSKVAECALSHANVVAKSSNSEIILLHVVDSKGKFEEAKNKAENAAKTNQEATGIITRAEVRIGNIFEDIGDTALEEDARLVIMGTHGAKGMQRLVGSYALKVITHSVTPFVVVQEKGPNEGGYDDIIMPLDINKKTKQKLKYAAEIASYFNAKVHIFIQKDDNKSVMNEIKRNLVFARNYFTEKGVSFATFVSEGDSGFQDELITYTASINADLICVMNEDDGLLSNLFLGNYVQELITNKYELPVMIVNPKDYANSEGGVGLY